MDLHQVSSIDGLVQCFCSYALTHSSGPFCGLLFADWGATVLRIDRPGSDPTVDLLTSRKASIALDLKDVQSRRVLLDLIPKADVLIDPFRPGVLERLSLDPQTVLRQKNPRLIVVRLTGFRRDGKYSAMAGHDINYLAVSGVLSLLGPKSQPPSPPQNILGDFAGGGRAAFTGVLLALIHRYASGRGQIVESNMVDRTSYLATFPRLLTKDPLGSAERGANTFDGGCAYCTCYECKDEGRWMSVGCMEPQFYTQLLRGLDLAEHEAVPGNLQRDDKRAWPYMRDVFAKRFKTKTRNEWEAIFDGTDACCVPVKSTSELEMEGFVNKPIVTLTDSPGRPVETQYNGTALKPGEGGEAALSKWMGWQRGTDYSIDGRGVYVAPEHSRL